MTQLAPYTNTGKTDVSICGRTIKPGETREVDARFIPASTAINGTLMLLYFNMTGQSRYFGEVEVLPGQHSRLSANFFVDPNTDADQAQAEIFHQILALPLKEIGPFLEPFTTDELEQLRSMEQAEGTNARSGLFKLLDEELNRRGGDGLDTAAYITHLQNLSEEDLQVELLGASDDKQKLALIQDELSHRKAQKEDAKK